MAREAVDLTQQTAPCTVPGKGIIRVWGFDEMKGRTLTRADLTEAVHDEVGLTYQDCAGLVERALSLVTQAMERGEQVKLSGFGVFHVRSKRPRMGRNPKTGEPRRSIRGG